MPPHSSAQPHVEYSTERAAHTLAADLPWRPPQTLTCTAQPRLTINHATLSFNSTGPACHSRLSKEPQPQSHTAKPCLKVKQVAQMLVTQPTSRSFLRRPRDSMGKRRSMQKRRPPYSRKPAAADSETAARKTQDRMRPRSSLGGSSGRFGVWREALLVACTRAYKRNRQAGCSSVTCHHLGSPRTTRTQGDMPAACLSHEGYDMTLQHVQPCSRDLAGSQEQRCGYDLADSDGRSQQAQPCNMPLSTIRCTAVQDGYAGSWRSRTMSSVCNTEAGMQE